MVGQEKSVCVAGKHSYITLPPVLTNDSREDYVLERKVCTHCGATEYKRTLLEESGYKSNGSWRREGDDS